MLHTLGTLLTIFVASYTHNFKLILRIINLPGLLLIVYIWLARESLLWLLVHQKYDRAIETVERAAKMNKIELSQRTFNIIAAKCKAVDGERASVDGQDGKNGDHLKHVLTSPQLLVRFGICIFGWITTTFITYGMSVSSVSLPGDKYWNFSITTLATVPAIIVSYFTLTYLGRKVTLCSSMILSGITIIASNYVKHNPALTMIFFFMGQVFIRHSLIALYVCTSEL